MVIDEIQSLLQKAAEKMGITEIVTIDIPSQKGYGDFATSIALKSAKQLKKAPFSIAQEYVKHIPKNNLIFKTQVIKPGFINIWLQPKIFFEVVNQLSNNVFMIPPFYYGSEKKVMVEFAHPNTLKLLHIGHMRNLSTGESVVRLLEACGNKVIRSNYQGDVGLHIAKTIWKVQHFIKEMGHEKIESMTLRDKIALLGKAYAQAESLYTTDENAKKEILEINRLVYEENPAVMPLWEDTRKWSLAYFDEIYKRVYSHHDRLYFESECHKRGTALADQLLKRGILEKSQGAIVFKGEKYGIDTRVFINSQGFPTYEGKELALAELEFGEFGVLDKNVHVVTPEQTSFFQVTFKVEELIDPIKYKDKQYHLAYNWVKLKKGKMSSRLGNVIEGAWLIDEAKKALLSKFKLDPETAETLAVASIKYSFLKVSTQMEIFFDFDESISLNGNSAPYLIYTYVRTQGILNKIESGGITVSPSQVNEDENTLLRKLYQYVSVVHESAKKLSPNILATYLFELAQDFNLFYQKNPILKAKKESQTIRILLTKAVGNTLRHGLNLLGIKTVKKM
ncbi:arginine--tRNA ligase [Candidatus Roizmanbacteria bacterium RIFOXYB2_FULL_38_10]|uniref:Arginine--tRNA ligase n=1 Tax=Candidatus Roizmanbacteria bacterium RIFOXYD1_FULL_38_12 TaxID=1802093 RepID=A0A1F7KZY3_9BACT|nr:MAG: arginine--tRNA ligase [Candidatus Roizmanbacteria bacterium RIFOXYA2_FULL_38_14]OGK63361.1 MAG: arginine--tRNA ligase [Candidatus Roizmanbacteria bacterium RIFOXYA1_FULL_37_12]OGK65207.1 MAG: arginine--tRNA ligase [Candidatus Roizmanbacteria bacterium RIFOXYB1_FULL_40_23]OGK68760.1 MAG: arginine--tRNA ligase [Candidatus Roizmanbacteria bacterium RIFOXYB2_FULL_38_10]OGK69612.1 MAG: arginine--tRNA ligase [Candidatus Roizmanbacteria bacterium RIFOXYC1_FULL_38_14]OGK72763.1 MAG: arginine--